MRILSTDLVAGLPATTARRLMAEMQFRDVHGLGMEDIAMSVGCTAREAEKLVRELHELGYVKQAAQYRSNWMTTVLGNALANAKFSKPVSRKVAERNLAEIVSRADAINSDPDLCYWVDRL